MKLLQKIEKALEEMYETYAHWDITISAR